MNIKLYVHCFGFMKTNWPNVIIFLAFFLPLVRLMLWAWESGFSSASLEWPWWSTASRGRLAVTGTDDTPPQKSKSPTLTMVRQTGPSGTIMIEYYCSKLTSRETWLLQTRGTFIDISRVLVSLKVSESRWSHSTIGIQYRLPSKEHKRVSHKMNGIVEGTVNDFTSEHLDRDSNRLTFIYTLV